MRFYYRALDLYVAAALQVSDKLVGLCNEYYIDFHGDFHSGSIYKKFWHYYV